MHISFDMYIYAYVPLFKYVPPYTAIFLWSNDWRIQAYAAKWEHNADFKATHNKKHTQKTVKPPHATNMINKMPMNCDVLRTKLILVA